MYSPYDKGNWRMSKMTSNSKNGFNNSRETNDNYLQQRDYYVEGANAFNKNNRQELPLLPLRPVTKNNERAGTCKGLYEESKNQSFDDNQLLSSPSCNNKRFNFNKADNSVTNSIQSFINTENDLQDNFNVQQTMDEGKNIFGKSSIEKICFFTGTVERIIKWHKLFENNFCYFEVIASVVSIQDGPVRCQKIILLRDKRGPILQVIYYLSTHVTLEDFNIGNMLRCVGRMIGQNIFCAISIRSATFNEIATLQRLCYIGDHAIKHKLSKS